MRQPISTRMLLTLIAVLSLQCAGPVRATLAGADEAASTTATGEAAMAPATADKATQTDPPPVTFEAAVQQEGAHAPMDYQTTDTTTPDIKQEKPVRSTASVTARPILSGSKRPPGGKRERKAPGGAARQRAGDTGSQDTPESAGPSETPRVPEPVEEVASAAGGTEEEEEEDKISINTASLDDLVDGLKGIGPKKGQAIIDYRDQSMGRLSILKIWRRSKASARRRWHGSKIV